MLDFSPPNGASPSSLAASFLAPTVEPKQRHKDELWPSSLGEKEA